MTKRQRRRRPDRPFAQALRRGLLLTVLLALLGGAAGGYLGWRASGSSVAEASVLVNPLAGNPFSPGTRGEDLVNMQSEAALLVSDPVAARVAKREGSDAAPSEMPSGLSVDVPPNTQILEVHYKSGSPERAVQRAQAFAEEFLLFRAERAKSLTDSRTATINQQLTERSDELARLVTEQASTPAGTPRAALLSEQVRAVGAQIGELRTRLTDLSTGSADPGLIIEPAASDARSLPLTLVLGLAGALAGLLLGIARMLVKLRVKGLVRDPSDAQASGMGVLTSLAPEEALAAAVSVGQPDLAAVPMGDGLKRLRMQVLSKAHKRPLVVMVATLTGSGEVSPVTGVGVGVGMAQSRLDTVIVDLVGHPDGLARSLDVPTGPGLLDAIASGAPVSEFLVEVAPGLRLLQLGFFDQDPDAILGSDEVGKVFAQLRALCDVVVVAAGSVSHTRTRSWLRWADSVVVEAVQGVTTRDQLASAAESVSEDKMLGIAYLTAAPPSYPSPRRLQRTGA